MWCAADKARSSAARHLNAAKWYWVVAGHEASCHRPVLPTVADMLHIRYSRIQVGSLPWW